MSKNLSFRNLISPLFTLSVMVDILYVFFLNSDVTSCKEFFMSTWIILENKDTHEMLLGK